MRVVGLEKSLVCKETIESPFIVEFPLNSRSNPRFNRLFETFAIENILKRMKITKQPCQSPRGCIYWVIL